MAARVGRVTASRIPDVMAKGKGGEAQTRLNYKWQLVAEIMTGQSQEDRFFSQAMAWGVEQEPFARHIAHARLRFLHQCFHATLASQPLRHVRFIKQTAALDGLLQ